MTVEAPGRRERKKAATRAALREAALRLVASDGLDHVTIDRIAEAADIAPRTFRHYFSCKEEAVVASAQEGARVLVARFRARPADESVLRALGEAVVAMMDAGEASSRDHLAVLRLTRTTPALLPWQLWVLAGAEADLAAAVAERVGEPAGSRYPQVCAAATFAVLRRSLDRWLDLDADRPGAPDLAALRAEVGAALTELAHGLDRPSA